MSQSPFSLLDITTTDSGLFCRWDSHPLERQLASLHQEIEAQRVKKRKTDREDARLLLRLLREDRFPKIWVPSPENRDLRQLLWHRHRMV
jgi:transposase